MASVLSTMKGTPAFLATLAMAGRSMTMPPGLAIDSQKIARVFGVPLDEVFQYPDGGDQQRGKRW